MSRLFLACSLIAALSSTALADRIELGEPTFAKPPAGWQARHGAPAAADPAPRDIARAPRFTAPVLDRDTVRAKLAAARAANLAHFRAYQQKGVFPNNTYGDGILNVWRDEAGNLCAAATIINASSGYELVGQIAGDDNFIRLGNVTSGMLLDWILMSGFTQAEIVAIQEPFSPVMRRGREPTFGPSPIVAIDPARRRAEDLRLAATYRRVDAMIVKNQAASLELATDRLMAYPSLAAALVAR